MPGYGPAPDREATGSFAPGDDTGAVLINTLDGLTTVDQKSWANVRPLALLIIAKIGSLAEDATTTVAWAGNDIGDKQIRFRATRSASGDDLIVGFDLRSEFTAGYILGSALAQPWLGADHTYAWAAHEWTYFDSRVSGGIVTTKEACDAADPSPVNYSGAGHLALDQLHGAPFVVPSTAPSDLRVLHIALWWSPTGSTPPTEEEFSNYMGRYTCREWTVGRVAWGEGNAWH